MKSMLNPAETNTIEYKEKLTDDLEGEASAFLNSSGGKICIGIRKNGSVVGVSKPDEVQLKIADRLKNNIRPSIMGLYEIYTEEQNGKTIVVVNFASGMEKPYYIKQKGLSESGCFIRIGSSAQPMPDALIKDLTNRRHQPSLINMLSRHQDLTFRQLKIFYEGKDKELNENFAKSLDFYTNDGQYNYLAYLLADANNVSIRIGKYAGNDKSELIENEEYGYCSLVKAVQKVLDKFDIENVTQARVSGLLRRKEKKLVDTSAMREAIINAFVHNDYSSGDTPIFEIFNDKFTITSYGGLVDGLSLEDFYGGTSKPRNREIMKIFKDLEFVEHLGLGMPKIISKYGQDAVYVSQTILRTTLKFDREIDGESKVYTDADVSINVSKSVSLSDKQQKIIELMKENPKITVHDISKTIDMSERRVYSNIKTLSEANLVERKGSKKSGYWEVVG